MICLSGDSDYASLPKQRLKTTLSIEKDHTVLGPHLELLTGQRSHKVAACGARASQATPTQVVQQKIEGLKVCTGL